MNKLSYNSKRVILGAWFVLCLLCVVNYGLNWGIVGRFGKLAVTLSFIVLALIQHFIGPSLSEVEEHSERKRREKSSD